MLGELIMYDKLKEAVEEYGEIMIRTDSGENRELHKHNAEFQENGVIKIDADDEVHWLNAEKVERFAIHYDF